MSLCSEHDFRGSYSYTNSDRQDQPNREVASQRASQSPVSASFTSTLRSNSGRSANFAPLLFKSIRPTKKPRQVHTSLQGAPFLNLNSSEIPTSQVHNASNSSPEAPQFARNQMNDLYPMAWQEDRIQEILDPVHSIQDLKHDMIEELSFLSTEPLTITKFTVS
jgi:hypothetical protein